MVQNSGKTGRFGADYRLQGLSLREIVTPFEEAALRIGDDYYDRHGKKRKLKAGKLLNALVYAFLRLPPEERRAVALDAVARLEEFMASIGRGEDGEKSDAGRAATDGVSADASASAASASVGHGAPRSGGKAVRRKSG